MRFFRTGFWIVGLLALPLVASAAPTTFRELAEYLVGLMNSTIGLLVSAALVIYFFGVIQHVRKSEGGQDFSQMRQFLLFGVLILFVMVSVWGILEILQNTLEGRIQTAGPGSTQSGENLFVDPNTFE
jgi:hypothetical protein